MSNKYQTKKTKVEIEGSIQYQQLHLPRLKYSSISNKMTSTRKQLKLSNCKLFTLFSFIVAGLSFRENFLGPFRESLISQSGRKIVFQGIDFREIDDSMSLFYFYFFFLQKLSQSAIAHNQLRPQKKF